ncbi:protein canopy 4-like [Amphiura filiformis]|uniref:protein canopy 4-like n=1 Tax=Amphiura filiformis TaxID=82378 RepID=UPI003B21E96B
MARCGCVVLLLFLVIFTEVNSQQGGGDPEDPDNPHRDPSKCEICKFVAIEFQGMMDDTGKTKEVLQLGYRIDREVKKVPYKFSELRLIEAMEGVCERIMKYNIHAERKSSGRFAKGESETFKTLKGLVNKGVKVELGIPYNMWDEPSAPVHTLKKYCDAMIEEHEDAIEAWFRGDQEKTLIDYLCAERVLSRDEADCLQEEWTGVEKVEHNTENKEENETTEDSADAEDDSEKKKQAELDRQRIQREIERQAEQRQTQEEDEKDIEREQERDRRKREREMERRRREREDKDGKRKTEL